MQPKIIDKLALIYLKDGKILMTLTRGKDSWYIPGGKREAGESDEAALTREVQEELAVTLISSSLKFYGTFEAQAHGKAEGITVRMTCYMAEFVGEPKASSEIEQIAFFGYGEKSKGSFVDHIIFDDLHQRGLLK